MDETRGVNYLNDIKDSIINAFKYVCNQGVLCDEILRGVQYNIIDAKIHSDNAHRNPAQIFPCARRVFHATQLASNPKLLEPIYLVDINVHENALKGVEQTFYSKRGEIFHIINKENTKIKEIQGYLPVNESFGFNQILKKNTSGKAFAQMKFSHWKIIDDDPFDIHSFSFQIIQQIRSRKGLNIHLPLFSDFFDKI